MTKTLQVQSVKLVVPFKAGEVPRDIDPADPRLVIELGGLQIQAKVNAKAAQASPAPRGRGPSGAIDRGGRRDAHSERSRLPVPGAEPASAGVAGRRPAASFVPAGSPSRPARASCRSAHRRTGSSGGCRSAIARQIAISSDRDSLGKTSAASGCWYLIRGALLDPWSVLYIYSKNVRTGVNEEVRGAGHYVPPGICRPKADGMTAPAMRPNRIGATPPVMPMKGTDQLPPRPVL